MAASTPKGTTASAMMNTIITVPKMAGKMPPSVFDSRGWPETNSQRREKYEAPALEEIHVVGPDGPHHEAHWDGGSRPVRRFHHQLLRLEGLAALPELFHQLAVLDLPLRDLPANFRLATLMLLRRKRVDLEASGSQAQLLESVVHLADAIVFEGVDLLPLGPLAALEGFERCPDFVGPRRQRLVPAPDLDGAPVELAPLEPLEHQRLARLVARLHPVLVHPQEILSGEIAVPHREADSRPLAARYRFAVVDLSENPSPVAEGQLHHPLLPEEAETVDCDQEDQARDQQQVQRQSAAREGHQAVAHRFATGTRDGHSAFSAAAGPAPRRC